MKKVLITDGMEKSAIDKLRNNGFEVVEQFYEEEQLKEQIKNYDAIVIRSATKIKKTIIDAAMETGKLKLVIRGGVGVDNIDVNYANQKGIVVKNTPNASSPSVAELVIAQMIILARHLHRANLTMKKGEWHKKEYQGIELAGKTLGLVGFGRIAKETAKKASALGMKIVYTDITGPAHDYEEYEYLSKDDLLSTSDFISVHIPGGKEPVLAEKEYARMKDGVYLINAARGGVICEKSLLDALDSGKVAGAALDVFEEEPVRNKLVCAHEKISLTPHIGASTIEAQKRIGEEIVDIILNHFYIKL